MHWLHSIPFLRFFPPFLLGILVYHYAPTFYYLFLCLFALSILGVLLFEQQKAKIRLHYAWCRGVAIFIGLFAFGYLVHHLQEKRIVHVANQAEHILVRIKTPIQAKEKTYKCEVEINKSIQDSTSIDLHNTAFIYIHKSDSDRINKLTIGTQLLIANKFSSIRNRSNPGEFDYASFCAHKSIGEQAFLRASEWKIIDHKSKQSLLNQGTEYIRSILKQYIPNQQSLGIAQALFVGYRQDIDPETYQQYTKTGLVHLIAISGLHMGIFYFGFQFLLSLLPFFRTRKRMLIVLSLAGMWLFALLTALPPSVLRAAIMFSFIGIGQMLFRKMNSINFLLASAFILLIFKPHYIFDVGFQLSYSAVLGILIFFKPLHSIFYFKNKIVKYIWSLMCLSLTAQVLTFPLSVYYFHQLPTLFLLTNLIAIPLVTIIIYGELLLVLCSGIPFFAKGIGIAVSKTLIALNSFIGFTSQVPIVNISHIQFAIPQVVILYILIFFLGLWLLTKRKIAFPLALASLLFFLGSKIYYQSNALQQNKIVIYNTYEQPLMALVQGTEYFLLDSLAPNKKEKIEKYVLAPSKLFYNCEDKHTTITNTNQAIELYSFGTVKIVRLRKTKNLKTTSPIECDYLIISDPYCKNIDALNHHFDYTELIIDGNIPMWKIESLKSQCKELNLPTYIVAQQGAKIITL